MALLTEKRAVEMGKGGREGVIVKWVVWGWREAV